MNGVTIQCGIEYLLEIATRHARDFNDPDTRRRRQEYRDKHPTEVGVLKCMDGRLHVPVMTQTPMGIIQPFRNIGGRFDLGWHSFQLTMDEFIEYAVVVRGTGVVIFATYHYSRGSIHRGCRGFQYSRNRAEEYARALKACFERVYGDEITVILCGIETDYESLILHGDSDRVVDLAEVATTDPTAIYEMLSDLYPGIPNKVLRDLIPLVVGNIRHSAEVRASNRSIADTEHNEWVLGVGRGFDWLHAINTALLVGPYDPDLAGAIETAAGLLLDNFVEGKVNGNLVLMSSAPYREHRHEHRKGQARRLAIEKSRFLNRFAFDVIRGSDKLKALVPHIQSLTACVNVDTREVEVLERTA